MKVDAAGLVAAARRVAATVDGLAGGEAIHPPLAADDVSGGAAGRLSTAGAQLAATLAGLSTGLVASAEHMTAVAAGFVDTDERNAARIATLSDAPAGPSPIGSAPPAAPVPPDMRAPLPAPAEVAPQAISAAVHTGDPGAGQAFICSWTRVADAATDAVAVIRAAIRHLPDALDGPASAPAISAHLRRYAARFEACGLRAQRLAEQASEHAAQHTQARHSIPHPHQLRRAHERVQTIALANAQSNGAYAVPLAQAAADLAALNQQAVHGFTGYRQVTDATTAGGFDEHGGGASDADSGGVGDTAIDDGPPGVPSGADPPAPDSAAQISGLSPELTETALGSAGGLLGGLLGSAIKAPQALARAGAAGLSGLTAPRSGDSSPEGGEPSSRPDPTSGEPDDVDPDAGEDPVAQTLPASGGFSTPTLPLTPSAGMPSTSPTLPAGTPPGAAPPAAAPGMMPMGMPTGGTAGRGRGAAKGDPQRTKRVVAEPIPHTEEVTGKVSARRLAISATTPRDPDSPPNDEPPAAAPSPSVRRIATRPAEDAP